MKTWIKHFEWLRTKRTVGKPEGELKGELEVEWHQVSLLRGLFESAGGVIDTRQRKFCLELTTNDSFELFVNILDLELVIAEPVSFGSFDAAKMTEALCKSEMSEGKDVDAILGEQLLQYIPIGFSDRERRVLPAELVRDMRLSVVTGFRTEMASIYHQVPSLTGHDVDTLVLVCFSASLPDPDEGLKNWVVSGRADGFYRQTLESMLESRKPELTVLTMTALLWYQGFRSQGPEKYWAPIWGSFLWDFGRLLRDRSIENALLVLENMAVSIERTMGNNCHQVIGRYLHLAIPEEPQQPPHVLDGLSDVYWCARLRHGYNHEGAWEEARREWGSTPGIIDDGGWDLGNDAKE
ncbi:hypothetical protein B0T19DRAFT_108320 [Cercophora scortea]|uniref:Uncharacterized protein n=1 Tax=Cercophora scortea TaxID=314031 RepID=A0AAE0IWQ3_9PEZI|nr:hypothetical protein B0T19DRAFT_108320 [Cercophora scortea]